MAWSHPNVSLEAGFYLQESLKRILKVLNLEETVTPAKCAFAIERSKGAFLAAAASPFNSQCAKPQRPKEGWVAHLSASELPQSQEFLCPRKMVMSRGLIGNASKRSLDGSIPANCFNAQQSRASQWTPVRSQGRRQHEQSAAGVPAHRAICRCTQQEASAADRHIAWEAHFCMVRSCGSPK